MEPLLATGVLKGTYGVEGYIKFHSFSEEYQHLLQLQEVLLRHKANEKQVVIDTVRIKGNDIHIKFVGIDTPEEARLLSGWEVWIPRSKAALLEEGEYYAADFIGCHILVDKKQVGAVISTIDGPQALLLEVRITMDNRVCLIPFMDRYVGTVDLRNKELELLEPMLLS
ncbi:MAG: ribosome maturation factor RimM [Sphaerochaetaceae bacterium]|nr:ribosome maturation factor RimM [Sphaerochaetaceae bacterium]